jgi:hypothetical protein
MKRLFNAMLVAAMIAGSFLAAGEARGAADAVPLGDPAMRAADLAWVTAVAKGDKAGAAKALDTKFTWTDASGKTRTHDQISQALPTPALGADNDAKVAGFTYGQVSVVEANSGTMHVVRIWVKRPAGYRILVYQEVKSLDAPPTVTPGTGKACDNPCKGVPYQPKNDDEKDVIEAYSGLESSAYGHNADGFDAHTAAEFAAASSNSNKLIDKPERMAELRQATMAGLAPTPLVSAQLFDFTGAVVMISLQRPDKGKDLHITRVWTKRNGHWVATLSYQTAIQPAS